MTLLMRAGIRLDFGHPAAAVRIILSPCACQGQHSWAHRRCAARQAAQFGIFDLKRMPGFETAPHAWTHPRPPGQPSLPVRAHGGPRSDSAAWLYPAQRRAGRRQAGDGRRSGRATPPCRLQLLPCLAFAGTIGISAAGTINATIRGLIYPNAHFGACSIRSSFSGELRCLCMSAKPVSSEALAPKTAPTPVRFCYHVEDGKLVEVTGDPDHPMTRGGLCVKLKDYAEHHYNPNRLLYPMERSGRKAADSSSGSLTMTRSLRSRSAGQTS